MKKTIEDYNLKDKKVIIRVDFNVPINNLKVTDDSRIKASLKTINYCLDNNAKVILLSHLGRIKNESDKMLNTLYPVSERLSDLLNKKVIFIDETRGKKLEEAVNNLKNGEVLLVENTRFEDIDGNKESGNDLQLAKYWASLGDIFVNDAFGTCHRAHASNVGIASILPSCLGYLVLKETTMLNNAINKNEKPFTVILGGAKVKDKIKVIENLVTKADYILIGGAMAYTFLKARGYNVGKSLVDDDSIDFCIDILTKYKDKIVLPIDTVNAKEIKEEVPHNEVDITLFKEDEIGLDIGSKTVELFSKYLKMSKTIIWNGPVGYFEIEKYGLGTKKLCQILKNIDALKIVGGGDTASAILEYQNVFDHISTGGGASLAMLEGKTLKAIDAISDKYE